MCHGIHTEGQFGELGPDIGKRRTVLQGNEKEESERSNFPSDFIIHFETSPKEMRKWLNLLLTFLLQWGCDWLKGKTPYCT